MVEHVNNYKTVWAPLKRALILAWRWERKLFLLICALTIILGSMAYLQFASFSKIVDEIIHLKEFGGNYDLLIKNTIFLLITFIIPTFLRDLQQLLIVRFRFRYARSLSLMEIDEMSRLDIATFESSEFQDLLTKARQRGIMVIYQTLEQGIRNLENISSILVASYFIISIAPILFWVALVASLPVFYFYKKYGTQIWWIWDLNAQKRRRFMDRSSMFSNIWSLTEVKLFGTKDKLRNEVEEILVSFDQDLEKVEKKRYFYQKIIVVIKMFALAFVIYYLVSNALRETIAIGALLLAFNSYRGLFANFEAFFLLLGFQDEFGKYSNWWYQIFDLKPRVVTKKGALKPVWVKAPTIVFEDVSFMYEESDKYALQNVSFTINSGEKTAIVGLNGAGKTSLVKLLCRVYDPSSGRITVDGIDLRDIDLEYWHQTIAVLFQDFVNYRMTVSESIGIGRSDLTIAIEKIKAAADKATATEFIETYKKGFDQLLWKGYEDGVEPSKGQRQKIAVARIFYRDALISILDEPTSAIDAPSEDFIFEQLENMPEDRSAVLISHRMSAIKNADNIVLLKDGQISEQGKHNDLIEQRGQYYHMYNTQAKRMFEEVL